MPSSLENRGKMVVHGSPGVKHLSGASGRRSEFYSDPDCCRVRHASARDKETSWIPHITSLSAASRPMLVKWLPGHTFGKDMSASLIRVEFRKTTWINEVTG